eukprot:2952186-Prymnesium_polylepis.1
MRNVFRQNVIKSATKTNSHFESFITGLIGRQSAAGLLLILEVRVLYHSRQRRVGQLRRQPVSHPLAAKLACDVLHRRVGPPDVQRVRHLHVERAQLLLQ